MAYNIASLITDTPCTEDSDFMGLDATGTYPIPLCSWRQAQRTPSIRLRIGAAVVAESAIEFCDCQGIYEDNSHKGQRHPELRCHRDVLYTDA